MNSHELNRQGRQHVEAELLRRGAVSVTSSSYGTRKTYLLVTNSSNDRTVELRIKTKQKGRWHTTTDEAQPANVPSNLTNINSYWVFVDFSGPPKYWIVPDRWIRNDIHEAHKKYLQKHDGHRAENDNSSHHAIEESRLEQWLNKWELLDIF
ncbi:MAG: hypothetical protein QG599_2051 [Pseudomonadota bacterium]|nr:hypothetical protein [Pseudomonadota bacterium]